MTLRILTASDIDTLLGWIPDEIFGAQWGALVYQWPLTTAQILRRSSLAEVTSLTLVHQGRISGFIEVLHESESECRLCRVIVDAQQRGQGLGALLLQDTLAYIREQYPSINRVTLAVFEQNASARRCYESVGFRYLPNVRTRQVGAECWTLLAMVLDISVERSTNEERLGLSNE
jgi:ribosomal protein S18 acetylase RimI-like enzyme